jgi:sentrin-specific protease 1
MISQRKELKDPRWPYLQVASWPVREIDMGYAKQTDRYALKSFFTYFFIHTNLYVDINVYCSSSCGLFLLNYIEYWTGDELSDSFTQVYYYYYDIYAHLQSVLHI